MTIKEFEIQYALGTLSLNMKIKLANNPNTPKEILKILATDKDGWIRYYIAGNPNTSKEILTKLSTDKGAEIRYYVARNPNTPKKILAKLSMDHDRYVRYAAHSKRK